MNISMKTQNFGISSGKAIPNHQSLYRLWDRGAWDVDIDGSITLALGARGRHHLGKPPARCVISGKRPDG